MLSPDSGNAGIGYVSMNAGLEDSVASLAALEAGGGGGGGSPAAQAAGEEEPALCSRSRAAETWQLLPEVFCAWAAPWWMAWRVHSRLVAVGAAREPPWLVALVGILLLAPMYVSLSYDAAAEPGTRLPAPPVLVGIALAALLVLLLCLAALRARVRAARGGAPNCECGDVLAMLPWACGIPCIGCAHELARLDARMAVPAGAPLPPVRSDFSQPPPAPAGSPRANWSTGLCGCAPLDPLGDLPRVYCALMCPAFIIFRLWTRLSLGGPWRLVAILALQVALPGLVFLIGEATKSRTVVSIAAFFWYLNFISLFLTGCIRHTVRARYNIPGGTLDDALNAVFCAPCALAQAERELNTTSHRAPAGGAALAEPQSFSEFLPAAPAQEPAGYVAPQQSAAVAAGKAPLMY